MRHLFFFFTILAIANVALAQNAEINKSYFLSAKDQIENMLNGNEQPNYEKAIFIMENAYYENSIDKQSYDLAMQNHIKSINEIVKANYNFNATNQKPNLLNSREQLEQQYKKALTNYAIYLYMTCNIGFVDSSITNYHMKYNYSASDPMASNDWTNTQITNLNNTGRGNCFALASLFKILSNRLNSEATLCTAPSHIYISHKDNKGISFNVELGSKNFPGTGTISTLTHSTTESIKNDIALRELNEKQSVALCLVYLAKGYEHKFNNKTDEFILQCAETAIKYDDRNLNALLLKAEYLENKLTAQHKSISQLQSQKVFQEYQILIANLYNLGYREMPLQMKNQLIKGWSRDTVTKLANETYVRSETNLKNQLNARKASLTWGLFEEDYPNKLTERIGNTLFDTKTKKITSFTKEQNLYNNYNFDPVVFAWNIDPLFKKFPSVSPYAFAMNSPIMFNDPDGKQAHYTVTDNTIRVSAVIFIVGDGATADKALQMQKQIQGAYGGDHKFKEGGKTYNLVYDIQVKTIDKITMKDVRSTATNIVKLTDEKGYRSETGQRSGTWESNPTDSENPYNHEVGHVLGLDDLYYDLLAMPYKFDPKVTANVLTRYPINYKSTQANNPNSLMGANSNGTDKKPTSQDSKALGKYILGQNQSSGTTSVETPINGPTQEDKKDRDNNGGVQAGH